MKFFDKTGLFLEKLFWIFLFVNPLLDIFNGMYISLVQGVGVLDVEFINTLGVTPSLLVRMVMLVLFAAYILIVRDKRSILTAIPIGIAWLLSIVSEFMSMGSAQYFLDAQYMARFCFNIVTLMVYTRVFSARWDGDKAELLAKVDSILAYTLAILAIFVIVPSILGMGYSTYADRLGYRGSRGFFYAGNDITAIMTLLLPLCLAKVIRSDVKREWKALILPCLAIAFGINAMLIIGSKTAFLSIAASAAIMLAAAAFFSRREKSCRYLTGYLTALIATAAVFLILNILTGFRLMAVVNDSLAATDILAETEGAGSAMLHGRGAKFAAQFEMFKEGGIFVWLFGLGRGRLDVIMEMDVFEVLFYYGIFGFAAMMWLYVKLAVEFLTGFFKKLDLTAIALFAAIGLCTGYLFIAGHVLFSVTSGFYFTLCIVYSRLYFAESRENVLLWKK